MKAYARRFILGTAPLLLGLFLATGCGVDHSPMGQDTLDEQLLQAQEEKQTLLTFSSLEGAAKIASGDAGDGAASEPLEDSNKFGPKGGKLEVEDKGSRGGKDDLRVTFTVPKKALDEEVEITMRVYGRTLSELVIAFEPSGLVFLKDAKLQIHLGKDLVDLDLRHLEGTHQLRRRQFGGSRDPGREGRRRCLQHQRAHPRLFALHAGWPSLGPAAS